MKPRVLWAAAVLALLPASPALAQVCQAGNPESDCDRDGCRASLDCNDAADGGALQRGSACPNNALAEACDGIDNDCDGTVDQGNPDGGSACTSTSPGICASGRLNCVSGGLRCQAIISPGSVQEDCSNPGTDDNCDGTVDNILNLNAACTSSNPGLCTAGTRRCVTGAGSQLQCVSTIAPGSVTETCNGQDDDCDGVVDNGNPGGGTSCTNTSAQGICRPGTNTCSMGAVRCLSTIAPGTRQEDCSNAGADDNCDGTVDNIPNLNSSCSSSNPGVCRPGALQCVTGQAAPQCVSTVTPGSRTETCNGLDDDCDGSTDEGFSGVGMTCATSLSGVCSSGLTRCTSSGMGTECGATVTPGSRTETCNGLDDDCDGSTDEGNPGGGGSCTNTSAQGVCRPGTLDCRSGALVCVSTVSPGTRTETCNGQDDDCDGSTDEGFNVGSSCSISGGVGRCATGTVQCNTSGGTMCVGRTAVAETCNGADDNCDGTTDNITGTCTNTAAQGICRPGNRACTGSPSREVCVSINSPTSETCNGLDDDCDGTVDDSITGVGDTCDTGALGVCGPGTQRCRQVSGVWSLRCVANRTASAEDCNGLDDNCDGVTDNNVQARQCLPASATAANFTGTCPSGPGGTSCVGRGQCRPGAQTCNVSTATWNACDGGVGPVAEVCNGLDDDCNGSNDNGLIVDADSDGTRACGTCSAPDAGLCDCNDMSADVRPGRTELCNGRDDNCEGRVDEGSGPSGKISRNCYSAMMSTVGVGVCRAGVQECDSTMAGTESFGACQNELTPSAELCDRADNDCDGTVDEGFDVDGDGFLSCLACGQVANCDCDDTDATIKPGAVELCDNKDQNCNGQLDDVPARRCFSGMFATIDTYTGTCPGPMCSPKGVCQAGTQACTPMGTWGVCAGQTLPANEPTGKEALCNGLDDDCDGTVDDGDFDQDMDGQRSCEGDCDDGDATIKRGALEICDNKDNDCDGRTDGTDTRCYGGPAGTAGVGQCKSGEATCVNGMASGTCRNEVGPTSETCNGLDDDCDGKVDEDFDGDGDGAVSCALCANRPGCDCDDRDRFNRPGAPERCDCRDNDCDGVADQGGVCRGAPCYDFDEDGVTNCQGDCNDNPNTGGFVIGPNRPERRGNGIDDDCDGRVDEDTDEDGDGVTVGGGDCDDRFTAIRPGAVEVCDGFDNNCDGRVDEGFDQDNDFATVCAGDCNDQSSQQSPFRQEVCGNRVDDDCDGLVDEDLDEDGDGVTTCQRDCNDFNAEVYPAVPPRAAAAEVCDGQDNDCNGRSDEGFDNDDDGWASCFGDCDDRRASTNPNAFEIPDNGLDDNCNGRIDEFAADEDGDGFSGFCGDCNDRDRSINPHADEVCDRVDNNCDAITDAVPGNAELCAACFDADKDGQTNCDGDCNDADPAVYRGAPEICDLKDNDCDGDVDLDTNGLRVCRVDAGEDPDGGGPGSEDGGQSDAGQDAGELCPGGDCGGPTPVPRLVVDTECGCTSGGLGALGLLGALALLTGRRRRPGLSRAAALAAPGLLLWLLLLGAGCATELRAPFPDAGQELDGGDGGPGEDEDGGEVVVLPPAWPCEGLSPLALRRETIPDTQTAYAVPARFKTTPSFNNQLLILDDGPGDVAAFILRRPAPADVDVADLSALETVATRELVTLTTLAGTPLVRDRLERFSRTINGDRGARTFSAGYTFAFSVATNAFSLRNRLVNALDGRDDALVGALPVVEGARAEEEHVVFLMFRLQGRDLFVGGAVTPVSRFRDNQPTLTDLASGSHLSLPRGLLVLACEKRNTPALRTDFVFVVDSSGTMQEEQALLANASDALFDAFVRSGLDFRIGVVTTDSDVLRGQGFTSSREQFKSDVRVGINGNGLEMGIEFGWRAIQRALRSGTPAPRALRPEVGRVMVIFSDEENTGLRPVSAYADDFIGQSVVVFAVVGPRPIGCTRVGLGSARAGTEYIDLATRTGGSSGSICNPNLTETVEEVLFGALGASSRSPLDRKPISGSLSVRTTGDGGVEYRRARTEGFDYDPTSNTILFFGRTVPREGTPYEAAYQYFEYLN